MSKSLKEYIGLLIEAELTGGPSPVQIGSLYLHKEAIMTEVQNIMNELAPQGVGSQGEYIDILEKALNQVDEKMRTQTVGDDALMADIELTLSMIERTLRQIPFQVFFKATSIK